MQFICPFCKSKGIIKIPDYFPRVKKTKIKCARCGKSFALTLGKLWPQETESAYDSLVTGVSECKGKKIGKFWIEISGDNRETDPFLVLQGHPSFSHKIMHDLADPLTDYATVCYVEFPGSKRNPAVRDSRTRIRPQDYEEDFSISIDLLKQKLGLSRFHLISHLCSCNLALKTAAVHPENISSLILIEPDLSYVNRWKALESEGTPFYGRNPGPEEKEDFLNFLLTKYWTLPLEDHHVKGLSRILSTEFFYNSFISSFRKKSRMSYFTLSGIKKPALILSSRDSGQDIRNDTMFLNSSLPSSEKVELDTGGSWAAWLADSRFANRVLSFKQNTEKRGRIRKKSETPAGQPVTWMCLIFLLITCGLSYVLNKISFHPPYMKWIVPSFLGSILPIFWFLIPKKINPIRFFRFRAFNAVNVLLSLPAGLFFGLAYSTALLYADGKITLPALPFEIPGFLLSMLPGTEGRLYCLISFFFLAIFIFGFVESILIIRHSKAKIIIPFLLFALIPPSMPDLLWRLPLSLAAALMFNRRLSIFPPLFLIAGFYFSSELPVLYPEYYTSIFEGVLKGIPEIIPAAVMLVLAFLVTILVCCIRKKTAFKDIYLMKILGGPDKRLRWAAGMGIVFIIFSAIISVILIGGFMRV